MLLFFALLSCQGKSPNTADTGDADDVPVDDGTPPVADIPATLLNSEVTWTLSFDDTAESNGFFDCSYTRQYEGVEVLDSDFLCPDCAGLVRGTATMTDGFDCYSQISSDPQVERVEWWGWSAIDAGTTGTLYRSGLDQYPLGDLTTFDGGAEGDSISIAWDSEGELEVGGTMLLDATGTMTWVIDPDTLLMDPWAPRTSDYACGWSRNDPGDLTIDYDMAIGKILPNVRMVDQCGDELSLWDLYGTYLVLDSSQSDCGPCQTMAASAEDFVAEMAAAGIEVQMVSMLGNGLADPFGTPDSGTVDAWISAYGLTDPVLYDRGYTYALFPEFIYGFSGEDFGYPAWLVVDPQMRLIHGEVGFSSWDAAGAVIEADAGR